MIVDDCTDMVWSIFLKAKSDTTEKVLSFLAVMKERGTPVRHIRLNNSGENHKLRTNTSHHNIQYEFTAPDTPQHNGRVDRKFAVLYEYMRSMINTARLPVTLRQRLWAEAALHATDVVNGLCTPTNNRPPYTQFYGKDPTYYNVLKTFGDIAVVATTVNKHIKSKMGDRGRTTALIHTDSTMSVLDESF
jgi:hypothetical protein